MAAEMMQSGNSDLDLEEAVCAAINSLDFVRESQLELSVTVLQGVVTLGGVVLTRIMRRAVTTMAAMVPGVEKVIDNLTTDADLQIIVSQKLAMVPDLRSEVIRVSSYRGLVTLHGDVASTEDAAHALELAENVPGVRGVIDRMDVAAAA